MEQSKKLKKFLALPPQAHAWLLSRAHKNHRTIVGELCHIIETINAAEGSAAQNKPFGGK